MVFVSSHPHKERKDDVACSQPLAGVLKLSLSVRVIWSVFFILANASENQFLIGRRHNRGRCHL